MDNRWQLSKCSPAWQSSAEPAVAVVPTPDSQVQQQDSSRNLMSNPGHSHPHVVQESCSSTRKMMADPLFPFTSNYNLYNSGHSVLGNSFLTLLSGSPSFSQCDSQQVLSSKPFNPSSKFPVHNSSFILGPTGREVSCASPEISSQNIDNGYLKSRTDTCPVLPVRTLASDGGNAASSLHDVVQARKVNDPSLELAKKHNYHPSYGIEQLNGFSSLKAAPITSPTPTESGKLHSSSIPHQSSTIASGFPRVFCLYASGDLFLSNNGLLGVVCLCHGFHMSVSRFLEHSGLRDVNPGDAVHMDSGETIAQWRKVYFRKSGIRIPEDHCGWHWPEGFRAAANLAKSSVRVPNVSRSSVLPNSSGPSRALVASKRPSKNVVFPNDPHSGQKLVNEIPCHELVRNAHNSCKLVKGDTDTRSNVCTGAARKITEIPVSGGLSMSKGGTDNDFQSTPKYTDPISKTKNSFTSLKNLQNLRSHGKDSDIVKFSNLRDGDVLDKATVSSDILNFNNLRDGDILNKATVSSNIELRLGQPSQQSQTSEKSNVPGFSTQLVSRLEHPLEYISSEPLIHNVSSNRITEESRQYVNCAAQAARSSSTRGQNLLKFSNLGFGAYSTRIPLQPEQLEGDMVARSVNSMLFSHLESPKDKMQTKGSHSAAADSHVTPKQQYFEPRISKFDSMNFGCNRDNTTEVKFNVNDLERYQLMDGDKGLGHAAVWERSAEEVDLRCHVKFMGSLRSSCGFSKTSRDKSSNLQILSNIPADGSDARLTFNDPEAISSLELGEHLDHGFIRPVTSQPMAPRLPSRTPPILFSSMSKNSSPNMTSTVSKEEVTRVKSSHMLSSRQVVNYSNQDHVPSSCGFSKDQKISVNSLNENAKSSIALPSKATERRDAHKFTCKDYPPELAMKSVRSGSIYWTGGSADKSAVVAVSPETSPQIRDIGVQSNLLCDPHQTGPPLPRVGVSENICSLSRHGKCCQSTSCAYIPNKCSCFVPKNSVNKNCNLKGKESLGTFGEQSQIRASILSASDVDMVCASLGSKSIYSGKIGELLKPNLKKVEFNAFQWKDVPSKKSGRCRLPCKDQTADIFDGRTDVNDQTSDAAPKCFNQPVQKTDCMEQVMSNISSKCSAPAITQASVKVSNGDSCTDDAQNVGCAKNFAGDEGSGVQKSWSSDDALDSGSNTKFDGFACKINSRNEALSKAVLDQPTRSLIDELRVIDSLRLKKVQNQVHTGPSVQGNTSSMQPFEKDFEVGKRKRETKFKILGTSFPASPVSSVSTGSSGQSSQSLEDLPIVVQPSQERSHRGTCSIGHSFKRRRSILPASPTACYKEDVHRLDKSMVELSCQTPIGVYDGGSEIPEASRGKKSRLDLASSKTKQVWKQEVPCKKIIRPVVCGRYGLISNGDTSKPAKIFSLGRILKVARRCAPAGNKVIKKSPAKAFKKSIIKEGNRRSARISNCKEDKYHVGQKTVVFNDIDPMDTPEETEMACSLRCAKDADVSYMSEKGKYCINEKSLGILDSDSVSGIKRKSKEVRKRSLYELITKGKDSSFATISKNKASVPQDNLKNGEDSNNLVGVENAYRSPGELKYKSTPDVNAFCHVCRSIDNDEMNCLLECNRCLIRVHQACYGISKVPKGYWYCRPCRENATNIVCVLCGYEGGVMTRAVQSSNIVKSLLIAWNVITESPGNPIMPSQVLVGQLNADAPSGTQVDIDAPPNSILEHIKASSVTDMMMKNSSCCINETMVLNSVTAGILDSTVKQWIHMVCGLWTPGTRCPNVDTMSTFDVSGACHPKENVVCSMCKRRGGCCIRCRVMDCAVHFHPWCAHQKGLLQSEVEGADNDKVGFYGRCELHATEDRCNHNTNSHGIQTICTHGKETCARTEGYKGRKREGFRHESQLSGGTGGCLVRQEQVDAWNHINRQMSLKKRLQKPPTQPVQDIEYDCRKEYARYKQSKGWKHLVVYKSGIHALGLYTSLFLSQGAMVVEYVGEIVGLRVADRRESDYQSGKKLQYKSACYFFRIDKEHIIDATRKGGIARFVNHSCQPNCVAKVITVRGEKKVVFFAERDIYPGEEITYDYHFNNEDEGKKILCSCNSKNCRRYLN